MREKKSETKIVTTQKLKVLQLKNQILTNQKLLLKIRQLKNSNCDQTNFFRKTKKKIKGLPPGRIFYSKISIVFHNGPTSNHRAGPILKWDQLQSEASRFTASPEAALYTITFCRDFKTLKGRLSCLWLAGTYLRESLRVDYNIGIQSIKCK